MRKVRLFISVAAAACLALTVPAAAYAGMWELTGAEDGSAGAVWRYRDDNGAYFANRWAWIDGNADGEAECYAFDGAGIMYADTVTSDGYTVNRNGAWTVDGRAEKRVTDQVLYDAVRLGEAKFYDTDMAGSGYTHYFRMGGTREGEIRLLEGYDYKGQHETEMLFRKEADGRYVLRSDSVGRKLETVLTFRRSKKELVFYNTVYDKDGTAVQSSSVYRVRD